MVKELVRDYLATIGAKGGRRGCRLLTSDEASRIARIRWAKYVPKPKEPKGPRVWKPRAKRVKPQPLQMGLTTHVDLPAPRNTVVKPRAELLGMPMAERKAYADQITAASMSQNRHLRPLTCGFCNNGPGFKSIHGHHEDYSLPLRILFMCKTCHDKRHHQRAA